VVSDQAGAVAALTEPTTVAGERNHLSLVGPAHLLWARSMEVADRFEESHLLLAVLDLLRTAGHDVVTVENAVALASAHVDQHPTDLVGWRALGLLKPALVFLGCRAEGDADGQSGSRWAISNEKAGRQIDTYSAPSGEGVL
jgi:hypothetical protein